MEGAKLTALETKVLYLFVEQIQHGQQQCKLPLIAPPLCLSPDLEGSPLGVREWFRSTPSATLLRVTGRPVTGTRLCHLWGCLI